VLWVVEISLLPLIRHIAYVTVIKESYILAVIEASLKRDQHPWAAIIGRRGDAPPPNFAWGDANASVPPTIAIFSKQK